MGQFFFRAFAEIFHLEPLKTKEIVRGLLLILTFSRGTSLLKNTPVPGEPCCTAVLASKAVKIVPGEKLSSSGGKRLHIYQCSTHMAVSIKQSVVTSPLSSFLTYVRCIKKIAERPKREPSRS